MTDAPRHLSTGTDGGQHSAGDVVVDGDHAPLVLGLLPEGVGSIGDTIPELGLSLLRFDTSQDLEAAIAGVVAGIHEVTAGDYQPEGADPVERLMASLRFSSRVRWDGWVPTMGKNRVVMGGEAMPYFSPKDGPDGPIDGPARLPSPAGVTSDDGSGVVIGVLDTRVIRHPVFADAVRFLGDTETTSDQVTQAWQGHGTFVTGLVHAHAPGAAIVAKAALTRDDGLATAWEAAKGLVRLVAAGADVVNLSLGCVTGDDQPPFAVRAAVERLRDRVVLVAAAGNYDHEQDATSPPSWPAALDGVLAVASGTRAVLSSFSPDQPWVDLVAHGSDVAGPFATQDDVTCLLRGGGTVRRDFHGTAVWSGTSFAAAVVAGRIAGLATASGYPYAGLPLREVAKRLRDERHPGDDVAQRPKTGAARRY
ncbi:MAG TPA: S8 family serine peptidase [Kineosporiaceae bacterium]|nr:S8 family serine peptidase [Kineosporiaceae bacterium]